MVTYHLLTSASDVESAIALISRVYAREGYVKSDSESSGVSTYLGGPTGATFLARVHGVPVGTISLVRDSERGLPMDLIYREELAPLRGASARLAEVCQFAIDTELLACEGVTAHLATSSSLLALALAHAVEKGYTHLTFTINPKHRKFYEMLGATLIGNEKAYASVSGAPALAYVLEVGSLRAATAHGTVQHALIGRMLTRTPELTS